MAVIALTILVVSVFVSSGSNLPAYGDEWPMVTAIDSGAPSVFRGPTRFFLDVPFRVGYLISPDSFDGYNLYQAIMILLRGILVYILFRLLRPDNAGLALVIGALAILYPGDVAAYILSNVHYMTAIVLYLLALIMFVKYWEDQRIAWLVGMGLVQAICLGMYEGSLPLILITPLILVYLQRRLTRRVFLVTALWYLIPIVIVVRVGILSSSGHGLEYQTGMVGTDNSIPAVIGGAVEVVAREFGRIWLWAEQAMPQGLSDARTWVVLVFTLIFGAVLWLHQRSTQEKPSLQNDLLLIFAGIVVLLLCYAPFVITIYRYTFFRTILFGITGAAIALAGAFWLAVRAPLLFRVILTAIFIFWAITLLLNTNRLSAILLAVIAIGFLLPRNKRYVVVGAGVVGYAFAFNISFRANQPFGDLPARQQQLATAMMQQAPTVKSHSLVLLTGAPETQEQYAIVRNRYDILQGMLQFIYKQYDIKAQICVPNGVVWGEFNTSCELNRDEVVINLTQGGTQGGKTTTVHWPYEQVIAFDYQPTVGPVLLDHIPSEWMTEVGAEKYNPNALIDHSAALPYRLHTVWPNKISQ
jgi:hypothetical protein